MTLLFLVIGFLAGALLFFPPYHTAQYRVLWAVYGVLVLCAALTYEMMITL